MKRIHLFLFNIIAMLMFACPLSAQTSMATLLSDCDYYISHSTGATKESFKAYVDAIRASGATDNATVNALRKQLQKYLLAAEPLEGTAFDLTFLLTNPEVSTTAAGWSITPTINYGEAEFYNRAFDFYQTLKDMRPGLYRLNVQGFYRNSLYTTGIENQCNAGCAIYGNDVYMPLQTLYYDATAAQFRNNTGGYANGMYDAQQVFDQGYYADNNVLFVQDASGDMTVGLRNENVANGNWTCFRNFKLEYLGAATTEKIVGAYRIAAVNYLNGGVVVPGESVDQNTPIYHASDGAAGRAAYWYMCEINKRQYALRNAVTNEYITYDGQRSDSPTILRYLNLTTERDGNNSLWTITETTGGAMTIRNVAQTNHLFDLRTGSNVIGTYENASNPNNNQIFTFTNALGATVTDFSNLSFAKGIASLTIDGRELVYDKIEGAYYMPIPRATMEANTYEATVEYALSEDYAKLMVNDAETSSGAVCTFDDIQGGLAHSLTITTTDGDIIEAPLYFTAMPMVQIYGNFGDEYTDAYIRVVDPEVGVGPDSLMNAKIRWRGATTRTRNKKQYAVKLYTPDGASMDASFFGLRSDNNWILDGMVIDKARMRNRVITDMWHDYAAKPYYYEKDNRALTGTRGHFVELTLNDRYAGIYCMTEKIDRKQVRVKKTEADGTIKGLLYKADDWSYSVFMGHYFDSQDYPMLAPPAYDNTVDRWDNYEQKHPDVEDGELGDWSILWNAVNMVATYSDKDFTDSVAAYFDLPTVIDYYILNEMILSADNHGKNMYWAVYNKTKDKKMSVVLWDLDATCGRRWDASEVNWNQDYTTYITYYEHGDFNLFRRLKACDVDDFNLKVRKRYKQLRKTHLHTDSILNRFFTYKETYDLSGASAREEARWTNKDVGEINLTTEMDYLENWFTNRMNRLDTQFDIASLPDEDTGITSMPMSTTYIYSEGGCIIVEASASQRVNVYGVDGKLAASSDVEVGRNNLGHFPAGIYIVNKQKIVVR